MWLKWFPWKFLIRRTARQHGFLDPMTIWSYLQNFSQPSEVAGPIELIRDSAVFHARGLINSRAIPQNSDWIWPYWVHRQFNPSDEAFIPRAFSLTYINLTERNWTAVGQPNCGYLPIIDKAGLVTPHWDGWSLDFWLVDPDGQVNAAARSDGCTRQRLFYGDNLVVVTKSDFDERSLSTAVWMEYENDTPYCRIRGRCQNASGYRLVISLRPYNPEGISFLNSIELNHEQTGWMINDKDIVKFDRPIEAHRFQAYSGGDVANSLNKPDEQASISCNVGMATAAAMFDVGDHGDCKVDLSVPLNTRKLHPSKSRVTVHSQANATPTWQGSMKGYCAIDIPDKQKQLLYERALHSVVLHTIGEDVYPGPFTYKRFWFRDASFILNAAVMRKSGTSGQTHS